GNGIDLIQRLRTRRISTRVLVWSVYSESQYADRALRAGAMGYITKDAATDTIIEAIRCVLDDRVYASEEHTQRLLNRDVSGQHRANGTPIEVLSDRELDVFRLIGEGITTQDIAAQMKLSPNTVDTYRSRIRAKLGIRNAAQLARDAAQWVLENN
ncbi:MAG: LuxR C-terminal-related transcriptional regulator, partial [Planctomycetota bacterium]